MWFSLFYYIVHFKHYLIDILIFTLCLIYCNIL